jgi:hypothetical protein
MTSPYNYPICPLKTEDQGSFRQLESVVLHEHIGRVVYLLASLAETHLFNAKAMPHFHVRPWTAVLFHRYLFATYMQY